MWHLKDLDQSCPEDPPAPSAQLFPTKSGYNPPILRPIMAWSNPVFGGKKNDSCGQNNDKPPIYGDLDLVENWPAIP